MCTIITIISFIALYYVVKYLKVLISVLTLDKSINKNTQHDDMSGESDI